MKKNLTIPLFIVSVFVLPLTVYAIVSIYESRWQRLPVLGEKTGINGEKIPHRIAEFTFINQDNRLSGSESWKDKIVVADFFFTHCPSICPKMTHSLLRVQDAYINDASVMISSFTVDPESDSAGVLKKYAQNFGIDNNRWHLYTGEKKEIYKLARNSFNIVASNGDGGPRDFIHSEKLVLVDPQRRIRGYYDGTSEKEVTQLLLDIKKLKNEN